MQIIQLMQTFKILIVIYILNNQQLTLVDVQNDKSEVESPPYCCSSCHDTELEALRESLAALFAILAHDQLLTPVSAHHCFSL